METSQSVSSMTDGSTASSSPLVTPDPSSDGPSRELGDLTPTMRKKDVRVKEKDDRDKMPPPALPVNIHAPTP